MDALIGVLVVRAVERLLVLVAGVILVYLGYRLFIEGVSGKSSLKAKRGDGGIELLNAAPGLFFCFFGFILLGLMTFKEVQISFPRGDAEATTEQAISILFAEATNNAERLSTDGPIPEDRQGSTSELVLESEMGALFDAVRAAAASMNFADRIRLQEAYETIYLELGIDDKRIKPGKLLEFSEE